MTRLEQHVVRRAGNDLALELRDRLVVDDATKRAWREDVGLHTTDLIGRDGARAELRDDLLHTLGVDIGDDELRAGLVQLLGDVVADMARALKRYSLGAEIIRAPPLLRRRLDGAEDAVRRDGRRVAGELHEAGDILRLHVHEVHVGRARAHVFRRDVAAAQRLHEAAVRTEDHLAVGRLVVADDDRLAAAEIETGYGVLVRHAAREAKRVDDRLLVARVLPEAGAAEGRSERGAVHGDDAAVAGGGIVADHELLVIC